MKLKKTEDANRVLLSIRALVEVLQSELQLPSYLASLKLLQKLAPVLGYNASSAANAKPQLVKLAYQQLTNNLFFFLPTWERVHGTLEQFIVEVSLRVVKSRQLTLEMRGDS